MGAEPLDSAQDALAAEALAAAERKDFRAALGLLMRAYGNEVYRFCLGLLHGREAAEDVLQTVFIDAFQALPAYEPRSTLRAWLHGIARHRCLDALKGSRRWATLVEPVSELPERADGTPGTDQLLATSRLSRALEDCLDGLPIHARETVLLRFRSQLSYEEMSVACGEKVGTLRVRVARALPLLRRCLEEKGMSS
jgi:RNA polymerase sigma-70 factor (ECF subfamily)